MKPKQWNEGLNHLDQDLVEEYIARKENRKPARPYWIAAVAAVLAVAIGVGIFYGNPAVPAAPTLPATEPTVFLGEGQPNSPVVYPMGSLLAAPAYPQMLAHPSYDDYPDNDAYNQAYKAWRANQALQYGQPAGYANSLTDFFYASMRQILQGEGNLVYSPVNVYLAMAMLAETAGGNSREQILDMFGLESIEQLRSQASYLWNAHYSDDVRSSLLLANAIFLDEEYDFHQETAQLLASYYYASAYSGDLGTEEMDKQLREWLNANTGELLKEQTEGIKLNTETVFALVSAIDFTATWTETFNENFTKESIFHSPEGDVSVSFMNRTFSHHTYYWGENFAAVQLSLTGNNAMWLILPDEGYTTADILASEDYLRMIQEPDSWKNKGKYHINLSLPKFDVSCRQDLVNTMKALGVGDVFDYTRSDFSPLTDTPQLYVDMIDHAARVRIDEEGCEGAAFTVIGVPMGAAPVEREYIDLVLDRPFVFVVSSRDDLPLFAGVVNQPQG